MGRQSERSLYVIKDHMVLELHREDDLINTIITDSRGYKLGH